MANQKKSNKFSSFLGNRAQSKVAFPKKISLPWGKNKAQNSMAGKTTTKKNQPSRKMKTVFGGGLSYGKKLEISGIILLIMGILTLLAELANSPNALAGKWNSFWSRSFGAGVYLIPLVLILLGTWILVRNHEKVPVLSSERFIGLILVVVNIQVVLHIWVSPPAPELAYALASQGFGGGYLGAAIMVFLEGGLGTIGMYIVLVGWALVGLSMFFDKSIVELFIWVPPLFRHLSNVWNSYRNNGSDLNYNEHEIPLPGFEDEAEIFESINMEEIPETEDENIEDGVPDVKISIGDPLAQSPTIAPVQEWKLPKMEDILEIGAIVTYNEEFDQKQAKLIEDTLVSFGAPGKVVEINRGPTITQFGVEPAFIESKKGKTKVRVNKIAALADDLALAMSAARIRIQAPVPGKGYIGIEVPNENTAIVALRDLLESKAFKDLKAPLKFAMGQDVAGQTVTTDLTKMPHLLVAGATGSGKSVFVNAIITCLLLHHTPETLRFIMVDPKRVELTGYNGIPHLMAPVITEIDRVVGVLQWIIREMDGRFQKFADNKSRNIQDYNKKIKKDNGQIMPYLVVVIDELADIMIVAKDQTERLITRLAQLARATGIHLVVATQRPSVDVITGLIKANLPARAAFKVPSNADSRVILDQPGAERLLGQGDMLFQAPDSPSQTRLQGVYVADEEILGVVNYWKAFAGTTTMAPVATSSRGSGIPKGITLKQIPIWEEMKEQENGDDVYADSILYVRRKGKASISMLQRHFKIGYTRSARIIEQMEDAKIIGPSTGNSLPRKILDYGDGDVGLIASQKDAD
jgi:DNA segregation ATPase FtsK/SpoIIIE, S-DNA-T family